MYNPPSNVCNGTTNEAIIDCFTPEPETGTTIKTASEAGGVIGDAIDLFSYLSIGLAVLAIVLVGIYVIGNVATNNGGAAAGNLKKAVWVLVGLVIVFNAPQIVQLAV